MDIVSKKTRSKYMAGISGKNTKPEVRVRKELHHRGFRYRLHSTELPGKPDIVLKKHKTVIMVNGCFWHMHKCNLFKLPKTNTSFWREKLTKNVERDRRNEKILKKSGWRVFIIWECGVKGRNPKVIKAAVDTFETWLATDSIKGEYSSFKREESPY